MQAVLNARCGAGTFLNASGARNPELRATFPWLLPNGAPCGAAPWVGACPTSPAAAPSAGSPSSTPFPADQGIAPTPASTETHQQGLDTAPQPYTPALHRCPMAARPAAVMYTSGRTNQARGFIAVRFAAGYAGEVCAPACLFEVRSRALAGHYEAIMLSSVV